MKKLYLIFVFLAMTLIFGSCSDGEGGGNDGDTGSPGINGETIIIYRDATNDANTVSISDPSGKVETAFCKKGTIVWALSVDASWSQSAPLPGQIKQDDGLYVIYGGFAGPYISYLVPDGSCYSETDDLYIDGVILRMMQPANATLHNINGATSIEFNVAEDHFFNNTHPDYGNVPSSFLTARSEVYAFFGFPGGSAPFYNYSVSGDTTADAYLFALEATIADGRTGPERNDYTVEISNAILENDLAFRSELRDAAANLKIKKVVENLKAERVRNGFSAVTAPIWNLPLYPSYYADLMTRTPTIQDQHNVNASSRCSFPGTSVYNKFAYPVNFQNAEQFKYWASKLDGNLSVYSVKTCDNGTITFNCPDAELATITEMREKLLDDIAPGMTFNGVFSSHTLSSNINYFLVQQKDNIFSPTKACQSGAVNPHGKVLALAIGETDWDNAIGADGTIGFYVQSIEYLATN